jgi:glycosyltransferase involved in cell wall biosynthesis
VNAAGGSAVLVVPCFNEAARLDADALASLVDGEIPAARLVLVDDGSTDATGERLAALAGRAPGRVDVLPLSPNRGKAEAVRLGLLRALERGPDVVGYFDADLSTPVDEIRRLLAIIHAGDAAVVMASRISLLGSHVQRSAVRHYLGRVFATVASLVLRTRVYDTQCGAKLFRRGPALEAAVRDPFLSRWAFDVELLGRLRTGTADVPSVPESAFVEVPLHAWRDVPGSKLRAGAMAGAIKDLARIERDLERRRRAARRD